MRDVFVFLSIVSVMIGRTSFRHKNNTKHSYMCFTLHTLGCILHPRLFTFLLFSKFRVNCFDTGPIVIKMTLIKLTFQPVNVTFQPVKTSATINNVRQRVEKYQLLLVLVA